MHKRFHLLFCMRFLKEDKNNLLSAVMVDEKSGRRLQVYSSYPNVVCYGGCYPKDYVFNGGFKIDQYHSMCLECQYIPNGINMADKEKYITKKDMTYSEFITYKFDVIE